MLKLKSKQIVLFLGDLGISLLALYTALLLRFFTLPDNERFFAHFYLFIPLTVALILVYYSFDFYEFTPFQSKLRQLSKVFNIHLFIALFGLGYFYLFANYSLLTPKTVLVLYTVAQIFYSALWRVFIAPSFFQPAQRAKALLIAEGEEYEELKTVVNNHSYFPFLFIDHLVITEDDVSKEEETLTALRRILEENQVDQVVIDIRDPKVAQLLPYLYNLASQRRIHVFDAGMVYQDALKKMPMRGVGHFWFFESVHLNIQAYEAAKRVIDIVIALPILLLYAFVFPFVCLAIKLDDGGSILSIQRRYGRGGKILNIYKIRTMQFTDDGEWVKQNKTNKVTRVGKFLRKSRLDEFTQLWNVLIGDVSLVGPRPDILANGAKLSAQIPFYMMRYTITPGLSGWAQVNQTVPPNSLEETKVRLQYDLYYVKNRSLLLDFVIMVKTFKVLVLRTGI